MNILITEMIEKCLNCQQELSRVKKIKLERVGFIECENCGAVIVYLTEEDIEEIISIINLNTNFKIDYNKMQTAC